MRACTRALGAAGTVVPKLGTRLSTHVLSHTRSPETRLVFSPHTKHHAKPGAGGTSGGLVLLSGHGCGRHRGAPATASPTLPRPARERGPAGCSRGRSGALPLRSPSPSPPSRVRPPAPPRAGLARQPGGEGARQPAADAARGRRAQRLRQRRRAQLAPARALSADPRAGRAPPAPPAPPPPAAQARTTGTLRRAPCYLPEGGGAAAEGPGSEPLVAPC